MTKININGFSLAMFKVGSALHITVRCGHLYPNIRAFYMQQELFTNVINHFEKELNKWPTQFNARIVKCHKDGNQNLIILIVK